MRTVEQIELRNRFPAGSVHSLNAHRPGVDDSAQDGELRRFDGACRFLGQRSRSFPQCNGSEGVWETRKVAARSSGFPRSGASDFASRAAKMRGANDAPEPKRVSAQRYGD